MWQLGKVMACLALGVKEKELPPELGEAHHLQPSCPGIPAPEDLTSPSGHLIGWFLHWLHQPERQGTKEPFDAHLHQPPGQGVRGRWGRAEGPSGPSLQEA